MNDSQTGEMLSQSLPPARLQAAAEWWLTMQEKDPAEAQIAAWLDWLDSPPQNREAYEKIQSLSLRLTVKRRPVRQSAPRLIAMVAGIILFLWGGFICVKITGVFAPQVTHIIF